MFEAHGSFSLTLTGRILRAELSGAWNSEAALAYESELQAMVQPLIGQPWASISIMNGWELYTPDCQPIITCMLDWARTHGLTQDVLVNQVPSIKMQAFPSTIKAFPAFHRHFVQTQEQAFALLKLAGFEP
jgi:hypothetical protein